MPGSLSQHRRENLRASILVVLDVARPNRTGEHTLLAALEEGDEQVGPQELRREIDYLKGKGLVEIKNPDAPLWLVGLTPDGVDLIEGVVERPPGVAKIQFRRLGINLEQVRRNLD